VSTCAFGTIFRRNSGELKAGKKGKFFEKKAEKRRKKCTGFLNSSFGVKNRYPSGACFQAGQNFLLKIRRIRMLK